MPQDLNDFLLPSYFSPIKITRELINKAMKESAKKHAHGKLIDLGCGIKPYETYFTPNIGQYTGVDYEIPAEKNYGQHTKADLLVDCTQTGLPDQSYNTVLCSQVLEHVLDPTKLILESFRLLAPKGKLILTAPLFWEQHAEPYDYYRFTSHGIKFLLEKAGFEVIEIKPLGGALATTVQCFITSVIYSQIDSFCFRFLRKVLAYILIPLLNFLALNLDRFIKNDKITLNYLAIAVRPSRN